MKSDHRHELKTNELADWIAHLPEWVKENRSTLIATGVVLVVVLGVYFAKFYRKDTALVRQQMRLTTLVTQLPGQSESAAMALSQGQDQSIAFTPIAESLESFAGTAKTDQMAALALLKRAEALRSELHYRLTPPSRDDVVKTITEAQTSYKDALERAKSSPALAAAAQFGLGLCQEELRNFDQAADIYRQVAEDAEYVGTTAQAAAAQRLTTMQDYRAEVVFKPAPPAPANTLPSGLSLAPEGVLPAGAQPGPNDVSIETPNDSDGNAALDIIRSATTDANTPTTVVPEANAPATN